MRAIDVVVRDVVTGVQRGKVVNTLMALAESVPAYPGCLTK